MTPSTAKVLRALRRCKRKGITAHDFPTGFAIRSRIADLTAANYEINRAKDGNSPLRRYWLIREPKNG